MALLTIDLDGTSLDADGHFAERTLRLLALRHDLLYVTNNSSVSASKLERKLQTIVSPNSRIIGTQLYASCLLHYLISLNVDISFFLNPEVVHYLWDPSHASLCFVPPSRILEISGSISKVFFLGLFTTSPAPLPLPADYPDTFFIYLNRDRRSTSAPSITYPMLGDISSTEANNAFHLCKSDSYFIGFCQANGYLSNVIAHIGDNPETDGGFARSVSSRFLHTSFSEFASISDAHGRLLRNTAIALIEYRHKYLLQLRDDSPVISSPNTWGFFGGSVEPHENALSAIKRELYEEIDFVVHSEPIHFHTLIHTETGLGSAPALFEDVFYVLMDPCYSLDTLHLSEGRDGALFTQHEILNSDILPSRVTGKSYLVPSTISTILTCFLYKRRESPEFFAV